MAGLGVRILATVFCRTSPETVLSSAKILFIFQNFLIFYFKKKTDKFPDVCFCFTLLFVDLCK